MGSIGSSHQRVRARRATIAFVALAASWFVAGDAGAFCRTTTSQVPLGYDPVSSGCWQQGTPLAWHTNRAPYGVASAASQQVSLADATKIADEAFSAWNDAMCSGSPPSIEAYDDGPITMLPDGSDCSSSASCNPAGHDVIVFDDVMWPHDDPANTLALTTVTYGVDDGTIFEGLTEVNTAQHQVTTQEPPPAGTVYDLRAILTHEAGHFFGLAHATETTSIMYAFYKPGATALTADDVNGFCTIYPPPSPHSGGGCSLTSHTAGTSGPSSQPRTGLVITLGVTALAALAGARRRRVRRAAIGRGVSSRVG
jgi:hypothetical protein